MCLSDVYVLVSVAISLDQCRLLAAQSLGACRDAPLGHLYGMVSEDMWFRPADQSDLNNRGGPTDIEA